MSGAELKKDHDGEFEFGLSAYNNTVSDCGTGPQKIRNIKNMLLY